jgi:ketopantoate hydroxymethyltransferase
MSAQPERGSAPRITTTSFQALKDDGRRIVVVTAYDAPSARLAEEAGVDACSSETRSA